MRYYKTERCIIDTENKGSCTKNGPHCAFAHGADDIRAPVFDINERNGLSTKSIDQHIDQEVNGEREKEVTTIDPVWYGEYHFFCLTNKLGLVNRMMVLLNSVLHSDAMYSLLYLPSKTLSA